MSLLAPSHETDSVVWETFECWNGVYYISNKSDHAEKESLYCKVREKENRIYDDDLVKRLPLIESDDPYYGEWELRLIMAMRLHKYLLEKKYAQKILDIGCGNGWMAHLMTGVFDSRVFGIDVNRMELEQAARLFGQNRLLKFAFHDILADEFPEREFDTIILAATIQYFPDLKYLINRLFQYLKPEGEIHIIDSPVYTRSNVRQAEKRTQYYYMSLGFPRMSAYYHHHPLESLEPFDHQLFHNPVTTLNKVRRKILTTSDSPFPWIVIKNNPAK